MVYAELVIQIRFPATAVGLTAALFDLPMHRSLWVEQLVPAPEVQLKGPAEAMPISIEPLRDVKFVQF